MNIGKLFAECKREYTTELIGDREVFYTNYKGVKYLIYKSKHNDDYICVDLTSDLSDKYNGLRTFDLDGLIEFFELILPTSDVEDISVVDMYIDVLNNFPNEYNLNSVSEDNDSDITYNNVGLFYCPIAEKLRFVSLENALMHIVYNCTPERFELLRCKILGHE